MMIVYHDDVYNNQQWEWSQGGWIDRLTEKMTSIKFCCISFLHGLSQSRTSKVGISESLCKCWYLKGRVLSKTKKWHYKMITVIDKCVSYWCCSKYERTNYHTNVSLQKVQSILPKRPRVFSDLCLKRPLSNPPKRFSIDLLLS